MSSIGACNTEIAQLSYFQSGMTARIDGAERCEVHVHVQAQAVVAAAAADAQPQCGDLGATYVHARRVFAPGRGNAEIGDQVYHGLLQRPDQAAHREMPPLQIQQHISDELARAVVGDLPPAVYLEHRDGAIGARQVLGSARDSIGIDRRVLEEPDLVRRGRSPCRGEGLHRLPGLFVGDEAEATD